MVWNKKNLILISLIICLGVISISLNAYLLIQKKILAPEKSAKQNISTEASKRINFPPHNTLVYTRCYGDTRQPSNCKLFVSSIYQPEEQIAYTFDFPKVSPTSEQIGFSLKLLGIANRRVIYLKTYWDNNSEYVEHKDLGSINLDSQTNDIIYSQIHYQPQQSQPDSRDNDYIVNTYIDDKTEEVYFSTEKDPGDNSQIHEFDLKSKSSNIVAQAPLLDNTYTVEYANDNKLYLSPINDRISNNTSVEKILDLNSKSLLKTPNNWANAVFAPHGNMVAYIDRVAQGQPGYYSLSLMVSGLDGQNIKEVYSVKNTRIPGDGDFGAFPYTSVTNYFFNDIGNELSYSIQNNNTKLSYIALVKTPPISPELFKTLVKVEPSDQPYVWTKFTQTFPTPFSTDGIIYESDGAWYLVDTLYFNQNRDTLNLTDKRTAIAVNAQNLFLIP